MHTLAITDGAVAVLAWVYLLLGRGWFWRGVHRCSTRNICRRRKAQIGSELAVVAVVPARNERATIGRSVLSLFGQEFGGSLHFVVVDDQSSDGTAEVARAAAGCANRLTVVKGKPLPEGWSGKVWAMQQGIEAGRAFAPSFFLLTDADVVHAPDSIATMVATAEARGHDLTSFMVRLHCESAGERLLIPAFVYFFFMLYPPRWIADPRKTTAGAAGGCMLVRAEALERAGGLAAIRGEVIDDCALARLVKRTGGRVWLGLSEDTVSVRAYGGFSEIGRMIARTAFNQLHHSALMLAGALAGLALTFVGPIALLFCGVTAAIALGAVAWALMTMSFLPTVRYYPSIRCGRRPCRWRRCSIWERRCGRR